MRTAEKLAEGARRKAKRETRSFGRKLSGLEPYALSLAPLAVSLAICTVLTFAAGCNDDQPFMPVTSGSFSIMTYNVAGLPEGISSSHPMRFTPLISPKLNPYDLVVVQEDFCYHDDLIADDEHPYVSDPEYDPGCSILVGENRDIGDGLNRFSIFPFSDFERSDWSVCNGTFDCASDCLTEKGFSVATHELAPGVMVDVYNLHMEAGSCPADIENRSTQSDQLIAAIATHSAGRAVIVAGDTNSRLARDSGLQRLFDEAGLVDSCLAVDCGDEHIDRVMLRSSDTVSLEVESWSLPSEFVDDMGNDLSDHVPVLVRLKWTASVLP
jgi:hypothetical protein